MEYHTILDWANANNKAAWAVIVSGWGMPDDAPLVAEAIVKVECDTENLRKIVTWTSYTNNNNSSYSRTIFNNSWSGDWLSTRDGGNADTLDGHHADDFVNVNDKEAQYEIPSDTNSPIDVPRWIVNNAKMHTRYFTNTAVGRTNVPNNSETWVWYYFDGINIIARENITDNVWTGAVINDNFTEWKLINSSNADTLDGLHANEIASNPNLLINPDFAVNQRGSTISTSAGYTVDRWKIVDATSCELLSGSGIKITASELSSNVPARAVQIIENATVLAGKKCTLSCEVLETTAENAAIFLAIYASDGKATYKGKTGLSVGVNQYTVDIPTNTAALQIWLIGADTRIGDTEGMYTVFAWAKLELGSIATPFTPPDPATELAKCQRYFNSLFVGSGIPVQFIGSGVAVNDSMATILVNLPIEMRSSTPTVSLVGTLYLSDGSHTAENSIAVQGISGSYLDRNVLQLNLTSNATLDRTVTYLLSRRDTNTALTVSAEL